tara:strand:+ start:691 stop:948 length:258 start_codon:yes stop_codon:yes gene_type:complete
MAYWIHTVKPIGQFTEKEVGNYFEYSVNDDDLRLCEDFPHKIWVADGYRYGNVKKTVAIICVDEDEYGMPVTEKWYLKKNTKYAI